MEAINITCSTKDQLPLDALVEFQGGLKERSDADYNKIIKSIKNYGFSFPFFVWKHDGINSLIDGHGRLGALQRMQAKGIVIPKLPVVYVNCKDEEDAKNLLLRLNSHYGTMTAESVVEFMDGLEINIEDLALPSGILDFNINIEPEETEDDDEIPDVQEEVVSQYGEIYELGDSLLMCGDSTKEEDVARLMGNEKADMVFTDPPYGLNYSGGRTELAKEKDYGKILNDDLAGEDLGNLICNVFKFNKLESDVYICCSPILQKPFLDFIETQNKKIDAVIVWDKKQAGLGYMAYRRQCEFILFVKGGKFHKGDKSDFDLWSIGRDKGENYVHGNQKPVAVPSRAITNSSKAEDIVLDFFGGSGSTLIACEKLNRKARLMELDPHYCDVIRRRYTQWAKKNGRPITSGCLD